MQVLSTILEKALPVFVMLALGVLCRKKALISSEGISAMKNFVVNITLPAVMFSAFATAEYSSDSLITPVIIFVVCILMLLLGMALCKVFRIPGKLSPYLSSGFEAGMLGYALFALLFPGESASHFAIIDLGQVLFVFTIYKALLSGRGGLGGVVSEALRAPTVWAIIVGIIFGATGLYDSLSASGVSGILDSVASFVAAPTSAVILLTIGSDLASGQIRWRMTAKLAILRLVIAGAALCVLLLADQFVLGGLMHSGALILMFILPPPYVLPVFAGEESERADISSALSFLTAASLILFMLLTIIFK